MADIADKGVASLAEGWQTQSTDSLRDLRTVLSFRAMYHLKRGGKRNEAEAKNCFELTALVRAEINSRPVEAK